MAYTLSNNVALEVGCNLNLAREVDDGNVFAGITWGFDLAARVVLELRVGTEILLANPQRNPYESDQHRYFDKRADDGSEGSAMADSKDTNCYRNGELEVIARCSK